MEFIPEIYGKIELGTYDKSACSPAAPSPKWSGVVIAGPKQVVLTEGDTPVVPICGYYLVPVLAAMDGPPLCVHVRRTGSDRVMSGAIVEQGANEPEEPPPDNAPSPSRDAFEGVSTGGYFNIDAQRYLEAGLSPGTYDVTVSYAGSESDPVQVEILQPQSED
jgi:hypothetical protein